MNPYSQPYPPNKLIQGSYGPPQPPWQVPPRSRGWIDPRLQQPDQATHPPALPYNAPTFSRPPPGGLDAFGQPYNTVNQYNTEAWGVKYNQAPTHQSIEQRPPLPPRPASAINHTASNLLQSSALNNWPQQQHQQQHQLLQQQFGVPADTDHSAPPRQDSIEWSELYQAYPTSQAQDPLPPPPPPRPIEYQTQLQYLSSQGQMPHEYYSQKPPSHHYEPQQQPDWTVPTNIQQYPSHSSHTTASHNSIALQDPGLVSPIGSEGRSWSYPAPVGSQFTSVQPSYQQGDPNPQLNLHSGDFQASVLGSGNPSDWEHFGTPSASNSRVTSPDPVNTINQSKAQANASPPISQVSTNETSNRVSVSANSSPKPQKSKAGRLNTPPIPEDGTPVSNIPSRGSPNSKRRQSSKRQDSDMSSLSTDSLEQTGTIDSVIQAWSSPLKISKAHAQDVRPTSPISPQVARRDSPDSAKETYLYDGLGPELRASLRRYVAMLRKESIAETNRQKFNIVQEFFNAELHFRSKVYNVDKTKNASNAASPSAAEFPQNTTNIPATEDNKLIDNARPEAQADIPKIIAENPKPFQHLEHEDLNQSLESTQPVQFANNQTPNAEAISGLVELADTQKVPETAVSKEVGFETPTVIGSSGERHPELANVNSDAESAVASSQVKQISSPVGHETGDADMYSPGGRPIFNREKLPILPDQAPIRMSIPEHSTHPKTQNVEQSPSNNAPMVLEDYVMAGQVSPSTNAPMILEKEIESINPVAAKNDDSKAAIPINFQPVRPVYTPFRYNATVEAPDRPADVAYSSLRHQAIESGRLLSQQVAETQKLTVIPSRSSTPAKPERDEAFIGLIRTQSRAVRRRTSAATNVLSLQVGTPKAGGLEQPSLMSQLAIATNSLKSMLPSPVPNAEARGQHPKISATRLRIEAIKDQFEFIHETFIAWDRSNREVRRKLDEERNTRQTDSEARIDELFNDNEIGYADIRVLEEGIKISEAEKKYEEDREEIGSFTRSVFAPVTEKLQSELSELNAQYTVVLDLLDLDSEAGSRLLQSGGVSMSDVMQIVLLISNKIEVRYQKIVEANVERERRRKHLEVTVLYTNGDTAAMKKLEREFATAEKLQVLQEARSKDTRINKLMDAFDRATVRGLGDNQTFFDELRPKVQNIRNIILADENRVPDNLYGVNGPRQTLTSVQEAVDFVLADSRQLLNLSNKADQVLNDADYTVSVAEARVSDSEGSTYAKIEQEKAKEDSKIAEETNSRLNSIAQAPQEITGLIREVVDRVGDDPELHDRIQKALLTARERYASVGPG